MDVDVESVVALHLQRGLHTGGREYRYGRIIPVDGFLHALANLRELGLLSLLLLRVVVARQPPCGMIASHGKLRVLVFDDEIVEEPLLWELIAETDTVVIDAEADQHGAQCRSRAFVNARYSRSSALQDNLLT